MFFFRYISDTTSHICQTFKTDRWKPGSFPPAPLLSNGCPMGMKPARTVPVSADGSHGFRSHQLRHEDHWGVDIKHARRQGSVQLLLLGVEAEEQVDLGQWLIRIRNACAQTSERFWNVAVADGDYFVECWVLNGRMGRLNWIPLVSLVSNWPLLMPEPGCQVQYSEIRSRTLSFLQEEALTMHFTIWHLS